MFDSGRKKTTAGMALGLLLFIGALLLPAQDFESIPVVRHGLSKDISVYQVGLTGVFSNMTAVRTSEGVVVFDALMFPQLAKRVRALIEKDFGSKIACLINTHGARDHTGGNVIFEDVPIYGHQNIKTEMTRAMAPPTGQSTPPPPPPPSPEETKKLMDQWAKQIEEAKKSYLGDIKEFEESDRIMELARRSIGPANPPKAVIPTTLIGDSHKLRLGGKTFEMYHNTPSYSESDIIIHIPEEKTLVLGDIFNKGRLPYIFPFGPTDLESWEKLFSGYISNDTTIEHFIGTHGAGTITAAEIREQLSYLKKLLAEVRNLKASGKSAAEIQSLIPLAQFPYLKTYNPYFYGTAFNIHSLNIDSLWNQIK